MHIHDDPDDLEYYIAMELQMRQISGEQFHKFENYASEIYAPFGLDLNMPATIDTPPRFIKALFDCKKNGKLEISYNPVVITKFQPKARAY